jgi:hypothetical protein
MKLGDLIKYSESEYNDRLGTQGLVINVQGKNIAPPVVTIFWETGEFEKIFADELEVVSEKSSV